MKAFVFPGQGSQAKGMGTELFDEFPDLVAVADEVLGYSIKELCLKNPKGKLNKTEYTQPALYTVNALSYYQEMKSSAQPDFLAGHSLGEFNALLAAECFDFETGLQLVKRRGELMSKVSNGGMAAILNSSKEQIESILNENGLLKIDLANYNTPSQIVISGDIEELGKAQEHFQFDEVLYYPLNTSGAFHSRFMQPAKEEFKQYLQQFHFSDPKTPVISNVTSKPYEKGQLIENLSEQLCNSVRWWDSMVYIMSQVNDRSNIEFKEVGCGEVLSKMIVKIQNETAHLFDNNTAKFPEPSEDNESSSMSIEEKVNQWNKKYPVGSRMKNRTLGYDHLVTRTEAMVLFGHRGAVYMNEYKGYFDIEELELA